MDQHGERNVKQVVQSYRTGKLELADVPAPGVEPGSVLVLTRTSLLSVGTERMVMDLAKKSLVGKARARPDLVKKVMQRISRDGLVATGKAVFDKLDQPIPLGYSCTGKAIAVGEGVTGVAVGDRVACAGAKVANHAEVNLIPRNLCVPVPGGVSNDAAAFVTVGAIALQGVRTAVPTLGETFAVIGLGLIGQIAVQLLKANGCRVLGIDLDAGKVALASKLGADRAVVRSEDVAGACAGLTNGRGVDGVLVCAATTSNDPVVLAGDLCRDRGRVVVVGAVGMDVPRRPYYDKELSFFQSRSYGPGRYDPVYEEGGVDYPVGYVRWTEQRNMEAFLQLCASGALRMEPLVTHRFPFERAEEAYATVSGGGDPLGVLLEYSASEAPPRTVPLKPTAAGEGDLSVVLVGAGNFATAVLAPAISKFPGVRLDTVVSGRGMSARHLATKFGFANCSTDADAALAAPGSTVAFVATRHDLHAAHGTKALLSGKHLFLEKPAALTEEELASLLDAERESGRVFMVGFNRRFAPLSVETKAFFAARSAPLVMHYRVNAGPIPPESWVHDPKIGGGRIVGEACHFIDLCASLACADPVSVFAQSVDPRGGARSDDNVALSVKFADGSVATISYVATGDPSAGKERLEVLGDGAEAILEDFRRLELRRRGKVKVVRKAAQDKGHQAGVAAFLSAVRDGGASPIPVETIAAVTRATFAALDSLATGERVDVNVS